MRIPLYLSKGSKVILVAPARKITVDELAPAINLLTKWGLSVVKSGNLHGDFHQYSGTDAERIADFQTALDDADASAIIAVRGGYGALRMIDGLDFSTFQKKPKWLVGYSDITVFHSQMHVMGIASLHGTMPVNFEKDPEAPETLRKALFGEKLSYSCSFSPLNRRGSADGTLIGGNLSLLYALQGGKSDLQTDGKILFLEDLDEYLYHIDRMMLSLKRSGKLSKLAGLVVGGMTEMKDNTIPFGMSAEEIIRDVVKEFDYPVCFGFPAGHIDKNFALKLGTEVRLEVTDKGTSLLFK